DAQQRELKLSGKTLLSPSIPESSRAALILGADCATAPAWLTESAWVRISKLGLLENCNFQFLDEKAYGAKKEQLAETLLAQFHRWKDTSLTEQARDGLNSLFGYASTRQRADWYVGLSPQKRNPLGKFFAGAVTVDADAPPAERLMAARLGR